MFKYAPVECVGALGAVLEIDSSSCYLHRTLSMFIDDFEITLRRCKRASNVETRRAALQQLQHQYRATSADVEDPDVVLQLLRRYVYNRTQQIAAC